MPCLILRGDHHQRGPGKLRAFALLRERKTVQLVLNRGTHQVVPGWMEDHLVAPIANSIMGVKHGPVFICFISPALCLFATENLSQFGDGFNGPIRILSLQPGKERFVREKEVISGKRRYLIERFCRGRLRSLDLRIHAAIICLRCGPNNRITHRA